MGKIWRSSDLRDKVTVVSIWGVYCPPCRAEQPSLQDFFNRKRSTNNVRLITFCLDSESGRVRSYMRKEGYSFPVIVNARLAARLFPMEGGIPKTFVIGPNGHRTEPFKLWTLGRVLLEVDKIAKTM
jgi:thiol-disulfide isomerase/thioredoxin